MDYTDEQIDKALDAYEGVSEGRPWSEARRACMRRALAASIPHWVPVPEGATIPAGVDVRIEFGSRIAHEYLPATCPQTSQGGGYFVRSGDLDKVALPKDPREVLVEKIAQAIADDDAEYCADDGQSYLSNARAALAVIEAEEDEL